MHISLDDIPLAKPIEENVRKNWMIWMLPVVALVIGGWLIYKSVVDAPTEIVIYFAPDNHIVPYQTELKYGGATIGMVTDTFLSDDLRYIGARVAVDERASFVLQKDTQFWMVKTRVTLSQVTGLETLVTGEYITFQFGEASGQETLSTLNAKQPEVFEFYALPDQPLRSSYLGGLNIILDVDRAVSLQKGAPVYFRSIVIGHVEKSELSENSESIQLHVHVREEYKHLVGRQSRFYDVSGAQIKGGISGLDVQINSLVSLILGGIAMSDPASVGEDPVANLSRYTLFESYEASKTNPHRVKVRFASGEGFEKGTPVKYKGIAVGEVERVQLTKKLDAVDVYINLYENGVKFTKRGAKFWVVKPSVGFTSADNIETLITGRYIGASPGYGKKQYAFKSVDAVPYDQTLQPLRFKLKAAHVGSIKEGVSVLFRGIPVGWVEGVELSGDATSVLFSLAVHGQYAPLVRKDSKFWNASGVGVELSLFSGAKIEAESLESLLEGGLAFATPPSDQAEAGHVKSGHVFDIEPELDEDWLGWEPSIPLKL